MAITTASEVNNRTHIIIFAVRRSKEAPGQLETDITGRAPSLIFRDRRSVAQAQELAGRSRGA